MAQIIRTYPYVKLGILAVRALHTDFPFLPCEMQGRERGVLCRGYFPRPLVVGGFIFRSKRWLSKFFFSFLALSPSVLLSGGRLLEFWKQDRDSVRILFVFRFGFAFVFFFFTVMFKNAHKGLA